MVRNITSQSDFESSIKVPNLVVVDFYGDWCGPCRRIAPAVEQLSHKYPEVVFLKVNDKECPDLVMSSGIRAFPTFQFFIKGSKVDEMKGADETQLERKITQWMSEAGGASSFSGAGNTLGGWNGVGAPPGAGAGSAREARLKALESRGISGAMVPASAPASGGDFELQEALRLSMESVGTVSTSAASSAAMASSTSIAVAADVALDAQDTAEAEALFAAEEQTAVEKEWGPEGEEMVPVPVDNALLDQLLEMGFSDVRARKGLVHGKNSLDPALAWLGEHEDDPDIDQPYLVRKADAEREAAPKVPLTPEEKARRVAELKAKIETKRKERERAEKAAALKAEKDRREQGQKLDNIQEERDRLMRKREAERLKKEKDDEKKERERLRAEIARDKELRRANKGVIPSVLGVDGYNPSIGAKAEISSDPAGEVAVATAPTTVISNLPSGSIAAAKSNTPTSNPASLCTTSTESKEAILQKVDSSLATVSRYRTGGDGGQALKMLSLYVQNIVQNPEESKYQTINMESKAFKSKITPFVGTMQLLKAIGFIKNEEDQKLLLPSLDVDLFREALLRIQAAERVYFERNGP